MFNIMICFHNTEIINTCLNTFRMFDDVDDKYGGYHFYICPDPRANDPMKGLKIPHGMNYTIVGDNPLDYIIKEFNLTGVNEQYVWKQTHHICLAYKYLLSKKYDVKEVFCLDDDTVILKDIRNLFPAGKNCAYYINSPLYFYWKSSKIHRNELKAYCDIVEKDITKYVTTTADGLKYKIAQYNAGHFYIVLEESFFRVVRNFYTNGFFQNRFFDDVYDLSTNALYKGVTKFNRSYFDEQRLLTHYFLTNKENFTHRDLNRASEIFLSKRSDDFVNDDIKDIKRKLKKFHIVHYVGSEKLDRARKFLEINNEQDL